MLVNNDNCVTSLQVDRLNAEAAELKAALELSSAADGEHVNQEMLEKKLEVHRESYQKQLAKLREEIAEKQAKIEELKE